MTVDRKYILQFAVVVLVIALITYLVPYTPPYEIRETPELELVGVRPDTEKTGTRVTLRFLDVPSRRGNLRHFSFEEAEVDGNDITEQFGKWMSTSLCSENGELPLVLPAYPESKITLSGLLELYNMECRLFCYLSKGGEDWKADCIKLLKIGEKEH